ncbi:MAG: M48 family metalloprotease [Acidobacteria bacterium]|nr:M48 family metalloprotease [Acidobacteriota bacterium]
MMRLGRLQHFLVVGLVAGLANLAVAKDKKKDPDEIGNRDVGKGVNFYSIEKEIAMGKAYAQDIERQAKIVDDPVIAEYVNRVGQNLVRNSDAKVPFTIKVIDSEEVNAFALPGGFFFVNSGLILRAESEAELAGVMAHEIAHVAARHGTRQATRGQFVNMASIPLIFWGGWAGYGVRQAASVLVPLGFLSFSRGFEEEADLLGLQYLYKTGYDPTAFVDFFEKLQSMEKKKPGTMAKVFSTHPLTEDRIKNSQKNIEDILKSKPEYVVTTSEFDSVKSRLAMLHNRRKPDDKDANRPKLRRAPGGGTSTVDEDKTKDGKSTDDPDERPTLKRRN